MKKSNNSHTAFRAIDVDLVVTIAEAASANKIPTFIGVSSLGASRNTKNFYLRSKAKMEIMVSKYNFGKLIFVRPSLLIGKRQEFRFFEKVAQGAMRVLGFMMVGKLVKYRAIEASQVAKAMIFLANSDTSKSVFENEELFKMS